MEKNEAHTSGVEIPTRGDFSGHTNDIQFIQRDNTVGHNSTPCYVDVTVKKYQTPNGSINYEFDFGGTHSHILKPPYTVLTRAFRGGVTYNPKVI